jgi:mannose-6-phosphate isomerase
MTGSYPPLLLRHARVERTYTGGKLLDEWQGVKQPRDGRFPESWIASAVGSRYAKDPEAGLSVVDGPEHSGLRLRDLVAADPEVLLGQSHTRRYGVDLGYLAKIIDSEKRLNVQTHPTREKAQALFGSAFGKTEAWYIIGGRKIDDVEPYVLLGFKPGITRDEWVALVEAGNTEGLIGCLHRLPARPGDVFFIESGVPHAIGSGCLLVEVQEPTDITFRVEKMTGPDGPYPEEVYHQGVGYEKMFDCFDYTGYTVDEMEAKVRRSPALASSCSAYDLEILIGPSDTSYFGLERLRVRSTFTLALEDRFASAVVVSGKGEVRSSAGAVAINPSSELFLPRSGSSYQIATTSSEVLEILICRPPLH